jgi:imidazolonepropionase-like amidohydrolase
MENHAMHSHNRSDRDHQVIFKNAHLIDGTGAVYVQATVVVEEDKIKEVLTDGNGFSELNNGATVIDLEGRTLMPGMILAHIHLSYNHVKDLPDLDLKQPPEISTIAAVCNARTMLDWIVVDGNPLEDISILEDRRRITHVMKGGAFFRRPIREMVPEYA